MGASTSNTTVRFDLDGKVYIHQLSVHGELKCKTYVQTHGSTVDNAIIVVNKVLWYAVRLIFVDEGTNSISVTKICERQTFAEIECVTREMVRGLHSGFGFFCVGKFYLPHVKVHTRPRV